MSYYGLVVKSLLLVKYYNVCLGPCTSVHTSDLVVTSSSQHLNFATFQLRACCPDSSQVP